MNTEILKLIIAACDQKLSHFNSFIWIGIAIGVLGAIMVGVVAQKCRFEILGAVGILTCICGWATAAGVGAQYGEIKMRKANAEKDVELVGKALLGDGNRITKIGTGKAADYEFFYLEVTPIKGTLAGVPVDGTPKTVEMPIQALAILQKEYPNAAVLQVKPELELASRQ